MIDKPFLEQLQVGFLLNDINATAEWDQKFSSETTFATDDQNCIVELLWQYERQFCLKSIHNVLIESLFTVYLRNQR